MSDLEDLAAAMRSIADDTRGMAEQLKERERQLAIDAAMAQVALAHAGVSGPGRQLAAAFDIARGKCAEASVTLHEASAEANRYALWLTTTQTVGRVAVRAAQTSADSVSEAGAPLHALYPGEYLAPDEESIGNLADLVRVHGRDRPEAWIGAVNPGFRTRRYAYLLNCVACAMTFADVVQGVNTLPAPGVCASAAATSDRLWSWAGVDAPEFFPSGTGIHAETVTKFAYALIAKRLSGLPPGTVAIIMADWAPPVTYGHAFNAYIGSDGALRFADAQQGLHGAWPPNYVDRIADFAVIYRVPDQPWRVMHAQDAEGRG